VGGGGGSRVGTENPRHVPCTRPGTTAANLQIDLTLRVFNNDAE